MQSVDLNADEEVVCACGVEAKNMNERCGLTLAKKWPDYPISGTDTISV